MYHDCGCEKLEKENHYHISPHHMYSHYEHINRKNHDHTKCDCNSCSCYQSYCNHPTIYDKCLDDRYLCDKNFRLRLGGLYSGMSYRFRQLLHCTVKMEVDCTEECSPILGEICYVGSDYIEVTLTKYSQKGKHHKHKGKLLIIPFNTIKWIEHDDGYCQCEHYIKS